MRVLHIITKGDVGGAQMLVRDTARGLSEKGYDVTVAFGEGSFLESELSKTMVSCHRFKSLKRSRNPFSALLFIFELFSYVRKQAFDIVHINSPNALIGVPAVRVAHPKAKIFFTFHGLSMLDNGYQTSTLSKMFYKIYFRFLLSFVDIPIFECETNRKTAQKQALIGREVGRVIHNGFDEDQLTFLSRERARKFLEKYTGDLSTTFVIGSVGRLAYQKHYDFLIDAMPQVFERHPHARCVIIGDGKEKNNIEARIVKNDLTEKIFLTGEIPKAARYLKAFDLFVLPSRFEGLSVVLIETLFAGVPVLATCVGGTPEIITNPESLFPLDDTDVFLKKLNRFIAGDQRDAVREAQRKQKGLFTTKRMVDLHDSLYQTS